MGERKIEIRLAIFVEGTHGGDFVPAGPRLKIHGTSTLAFPSNFHFPVSETGKTDANRAAEQLQKYINQENKTSKGKKK